MMSLWLPQLPVFFMPYFADSKATPFPPSTHFGLPSLNPLSVRSITSLPSALIRAMSVLFQPPTPI